MKAIVTGSHGTVGGALMHSLRASGHHAIPWERRETPIDDYARIEAFIRDSGADILYHLAIASQATGAPNEVYRVNYHWPSELAWATRQLGVRMVYVSTVMVFTNDAEGPFTPASVPDAKEGYGAEKLAAEQRVRAQSPDALIARIGWQIGDEPTGNNMLAHFDREQAERGCVRASRRWLPACSFLLDTARALIALADAPPDIYHLDANRALDFYSIASALSHRHGNRWTITPTDDFVYDQRMVDPRITLPSIDERLARSAPQRSEP